jgi:hypothetical protein
MIEGLPKPNQNNPTLTKATGEMGLSISKIGLAMIFPHFESPMTTPSITPKKIAINSPDMARKREWKIWRNTDPFIIK